MKIFFVAKAFISNKVLLTLNRAEAKRISFFKAPLYAAEY